MILVIILGLVIFIKLYQYKYEPFEGTCIKPIENNLTFSLTKNKLQQMFDNYGDDDAKMKEAIGYYAIKDLSDNVDFESIIYNTTDGGMNIVDPVNDTNQQLFSASDCKLNYL